MSNKPLVSIGCVVYNHESFLEQTLEGMLSQKVNFTYEIVIHDDASTDKSAEIIKRYEKKYPNIIRAIYEEKNRYGKPPGIIERIMAKAYRGKYIALCEGDDFWIDRNKLQIQVDYMEQHPDCTMTMHDAMVLDYFDQSLYPFHPCLGDHDLTARECIARNSNILFPTASYMIKREMLEWIGFCGETMVGDYPLRLYCFAKGKIHYFDRIMSVYRYGHAGSWSDMQRTVPYKSILHGANMAGFLLKYNEYTGYKYTEDVSEMAVRMLHAAVYNCRQISFQEFLCECERCEVNTDGKYHFFLEKMKRLFKQIADSEYIEKSFAGFLAQYEHLIIMGAGECGKTIANKLDKRGVAYDGFAISDSQVLTEKNRGKQVWHLRDLPFPKESTGVIVAVSPKTLNEVLESLRAAHIENYFVPYDDIKWETQDERR